jgi:uncharacterized repeat protein (TIGR02543 family)
LVYGGEAVAKTGYLTYWAGDGGNLTSSNYDGSTITMNFTMGWAWYGVQLFYIAPYATPSNDYAISATINSSVSGSVTIDGKAVSLTANANYDFSTDFTQGNGATFGMQMGVDGTPLGNATVRISNLKIVDNTKTNVYHEVTFKNGDSVVGTVLAKEGETLWTYPTDPTPAEGYVFDGWFYGDTEFKPRSDVVNGDFTVTAKFIQSATYSVKLYNGGELLDTLTVAEGKTVTIPSDLNYGFAHKANGWYKDSAFENAWNFDTDTITAETSLYVRTAIYPDETYENSQDLGWKIADQYMAMQDDGSFLYSGEAPFGGSESWHRQINFDNVPVGVSGTNYALTFEYKMNYAADTKIWDNVANTDNGTTTSLAVAASWTKIAINFAGGVFNANSKLSFELGTQSGNDTVTFALRDVTVAAA